MKIYPTPIAAAFASCFAAAVAAQTTLHMFTGGLTAGSVKG